MKKIKEMVSYVFFRIALIISLAILLGGPFALLISVSRFYEILDIGHIFKKLFTISKFYIIKRTEENYMKVTFNDPGLYGVFTGEMIGQFSDGYWENSVKFRKDHNLYKLSETFFDENSRVIPTIRYNINSFFTHCAESGYLTCIITRVLMVYNHGELIKKVYNTEGKEKADDLISILADPVYFSELGIIDINTLQGYYRGCCERSLKTIDKYFGSIENFKNAIPAITPENIKKFRKIGRELNDSFIHVKNFYDLH